MALAQKLVKYVPADRNPSVVILGKNENELVDYTVCLVLYGSQIIPNAHLI